MHQASFRQNLSVSPFITDAGSYSSSLVSVGEWKYLPQRAKTTPRVVDPFQTTWEGVGHVGEMMGGSGGEDSMEKDGMMSFEVRHHAEDVGEIAIEYVDGNKSFDKPVPFTVIAHGLTTISSYEKPVKLLDFICPISSK